MKRIEVPLPDRCIGKRSQFPLPGTVKRSQVPLLDRCGALIKNNVKVKVQVGRCTVKRSHIPLPGRCTVKEVRFGYRLRCETKSGSATR